MSDVLGYVGEKKKIHHITIQHYLIIDIDEYAYFSQTFFALFSYVPTQDGTVYLLNKITKHKLFNDSLKM